MCFGTCRKIRQNILTTTSSFHAQNTIPSPSKNNLRRHDHNAFSLEETTTHMISRKVLDKSATQDKSATLHSVSGEDRKKQRGTRRRAGSGGERGRDGRACKHCFKNLIPPTCKKKPIDDVKCQNVKCQNVNIFGVELLARVSRLHNV